MKAWLLVLTLALAGAAQGARLQVDGGNSRLRDLLATHLDLARALARAERDPQLAPDTAERQRLCLLVPQQARALLETEGYFNPQQLQLDCEALRLQIDPGELSRVRAVVLRAVQGEDSAEASPESSPEGPAAGTALAENDERLRRRWQRAFGLREGEAFTQAAWGGGKRALLAAIRADGHPLARYRFSDAAVDPATNAVDLRVHVELGPAVRIGQLRFDGLKYHEEDRARELLGLQAGDAYTEPTLLDAQDRLLKSGLYDSVQVELDTESLREEAGESRMDVRVRVKESPLQQLGLGLGWSSGTQGSGERVTVEHQHRRAFGLPLRSTLKTVLARDNQLASLEFSTHPQARLRRNLASLAWEREDGQNVAAYRQAALRLGQVFESRPYDRSVAVELLTSRQGKGELAASSDALLLHWNPTWRTVDSVLLPRRGQALLLQVAGGEVRSRSDGESARGSLGRLQARWLGYWPLSRGRLVSTRLEAGQVWAGSSALVLPESLLFRAGGDESVRGYGRRTLGPSREGQGIGGRVQWSSSLEYQQPLPTDWTFGLDGIGWAAFVDAGQAATRWQDAQPAVGAGLGLRWRSPVGLLRVDAARGQEKYGGGWRLHLSLGMSL